MRHQDRTDILIGEAKSVTNPIFSIHLSRIASVKSLSQIMACTKSYVRHHTRGTAEMRRPEPDAKSIYIIDLIYLILNGAPTTPSSRNTPDRIGEPGPFFGPIFVRKTA